MHRGILRVLFVFLSLAFGCAVFFGVFRYHLKAVPTANYENRDDALITLSHARNLVEFGFIGVSPSGERVEGFSAPAQFWIAAGVYAVTRFDYTTFFRWQTTLGTLTLGALFAGLLLGSGESEHAHWRSLFAVVAIVASAWILADSRAFLLWHASGMENAYKSVALLALLWALDAMLRKGRVYWIAAALIPVAALTRVDAIVPVAALLVVFLVLWRIRHLDARALALVAIGLTPWVAYMVWRRWYFGDWEPNTAIAQSISVADRLRALVHSPAAAIAEYLDWSKDIGWSLHAFQLAWLPVLVLLLRRHPVAVNRAAMVAAGALACLAQYVLFGRARLDIARTVTELALYSTAAVPFVYAGRTEFRLKDLVTGVLILVSSVAVVSYIPPDRTEIGWGTSVFEPGADRFEAFAREQDVVRPTVANADLGAVSWRKGVNVIDLGRLGSAVIPRIESPGQYVSEFAGADLIEIHDAWSCLYRDLFTTPAFIREYVPLTAARTPWISEHCPDAPAAMTGFWARRAILRNSGSTERVFMDRFVPTLDTTLVERELATCLAAPGPRSCAYVGRTLFRVVPELKRAGRYSAVAALLAREERLRVEHAYFTSSTDPHWWRDVLAAFQPLSVKPGRLSFFALVDGSRSSHAVITLDDPLDLGWRAVPPPDLFDIRPAGGTGAATLALVPKRTQAPTDRTVEIPIFAGHETSPSKTLVVRFKSMASVPPGPPTGSVDAPPDPVRLGDELVTFQGWALDPFDLRRVFVAYTDSAGEMVMIGEARPTGMRPDVAAAFPDAHDLLNSGWTFVLDPRTLRGVRRPVMLHFLARGAGREAEIGTRVIAK